MMGLFLILLYCCRMLVSDDKRHCIKCKKLKPEKDGYLKLKGMFFCCKECCGKEGTVGGKKSKVCDFC